MSQLQTPSKRQRCAEESDLPQFTESPQSVVQQTLSSADVDDHDQARVVDAFNAMPNDDDDDLLVFSWSQAGLEAAVARVGAGVTPTDIKNTVLDAMEHAGGRRLDASRDEFVSFKFIQAYNDAIATLKREHSQYFVLSAAMRDQFAPGSVVVPPICKVFSVAKAEYSTPNVGLMVAFEF